VSAEAAQSSLDPTCHRGRRPSQARGLQRSRSIASDLMGVSTGAKNA